MIGSLNGKVIELNRSGFRMASEFGGEVQVEANREWKGFVNVGDEVNVKGGFGENGKYLMAWMSVCREGQWLDIEDFRNPHTFWLKAVIFGACALILLTALMIWRIFG